MHFVYHYCLWSSSHHLHEQWKWAHSLSLSLGGIVDVHSCWLNKRSWLCIIVDALFSTENKQPSNSRRRRKKNGCSRTTSTTYTYNNTCIRNECNDFNHSTRTMNGWAHIFCLALRLRWVYACRMNRNIFQFNTWYMFVFV